MTPNYPAKYVAVFSLLLICIASGMLRAQNTSTPKFEVPAEPGYVISGVSNDSDSSDTDDGNVTGATVRGLALYEDTGRPVRNALVTLAKNGRDTYGGKYVKTDDKGEFIFKNVKEGVYFPIVKGAGIIEEHPDTVRAQEKGAKDKEEEKPVIAVSGLGEFRTIVKVRRGGAITGRIIYADGEAAIGVKVQVLRKMEGGYYVATYDSKGSETTDDRGVYRVAGLVGGTYIARVIEPEQHGPGKPDYDFNFRDRQGSVSRTYYPEGDMSKGAKEIELQLGQEQSGVDIMIPDRQRFTLSGKIIRKRDSEPLEKFNVTFVNLTQADPTVLEYGGGGMAINSNKAGEWAVRNLPKGKYRFTVSQGYIDRSEKEKEKPETYPSMSKEIEITDRDISGVGFEIPTGANITGSITVEGDKDVPDDLRVVAVNSETGAVKTDDWNYEPAQAKKTPKLQNFRVADLPEGKYRLFTGTNDYFIKSISGVPPGSDSTLDVKEGDSITGIKIVLSGDTGTVKGNVSGANPGDLIVVVIVKPGAPVNQLGINSRGAAMTPNGTFELKWSPGEYIIFAFNAKTRPTNPDEAKEWVEKLIREGSRITIKSGEITNAQVSVVK